MTSVLPSVADLSLEEKIGQLLCLGWMSPDCLLNINAQARTCVQEWKAGGMVVMGRNISPGVRPLPPIDVPSVHAMLTELQDISDIPLLLATDQEGGRVARFGTPPFTRMPDVLAIGDRNDAPLAYEAALVTARELAAVGINWNFAPVADVNSNPDNPVIGDRSFGSTVEVVVPMVTAQVRGYREGGVLSCAKHFPGHGDTAVDSHYDLPHLPFAPDTISERELVPFRAAIEAGIPTIMTAHILFPAFDTELPATMSRSIITGLLREQLGFTGLTVTDCLEMKAIATHWGTAQGAVRAIQAGVDMVMVCHTFDRQRETREALLAAARSGEISPERVDEAVGRVLAAKYEALTMPRPALSVVGSPDHVAVRERFTVPSDNTPTVLGAESPR